MISSGTTALTVSSDDPVTLMTIAGTIRHLVIVNGGAAGFFSVDSGVSWCPFPATATLVLNDLPVSGGTLQVKNIPGGTNLSALYAFGY